MAHSVLLSIATAGFALALTGLTATSSQAMSFNDYDGSAEKLGNRADVSELFSGRLKASENRRLKQADALKEIREGQSILPAFVTTEPSEKTQRPISLTLPF